MTFIATHRRFSHLEINRKYGVSNRIGYYHYIAHDKRAERGYKKASARVRYGRVVSHEPSPYSLYTNAQFS